MDIKKTITTIFMVPTLGFPVGQLDANGFINGYSYDPNCHIEYEDVIYLLFKPTDLVQFREFLDNEYERTKMIVEDYNHQNNHVVVVYKTNPSFKPDFDLIRKSKYSKTSPAFQKLFPRTVKINIRGYWKDDLSLQYRIFNRTKDLIEFWENKFGMVLDDSQEVWFAFVEEKETLSINTDES